MALDVDLHSGVHGGSGVALSKRLEKAAWAVLGPPVASRVRTNDLATRALFWPIGPALAGITRLSFVMPRGEEAAIELRASGQTMLYGRHPSGGLVVASVRSLVDASPLPDSEVWRLVAGLERELTDYGCTFGGWKGPLESLAAMEAQEAERRAEAARRLEEFRNSPAAADTGRWERYATTALDGACRDVAAASIGSRTSTLFSKAAHLGSTFAAVGVPGPEVVGTGLVLAAQEAGLTETKAQATFAAGWERGVACPEPPKDRPRPSTARRPEPPHTAEEHDG